MERDPAPFLPAHIREVLKRKSSRDPASRFPKKLHSLLTYVTEVPGLEEQVGLAWVADDEFKMSKNTLASVMGIKLNTLNVNLRDLHFSQTQRDKDGWTRWKKAGFTRSGTGIDPDDGLPSPLRTTAKVDAGFVGRAPSIPFNLGKLTDQMSERFLMESQQLWTSVFQCSPTSPVQTDAAIEKAALRFRYQEQPLENAKDVIDAIVRPATSDSRMVFADFCRFLAMFGPEKTIMLKIASLLTCSNASGKWLSFDRDHSGARPPYAYFDLQMPNCLVIHHGDNSQERVYNNPIVEAGTETYLVDDSGKGCKDWDEWFTKHPVRGMPPYGMFGLVG
jgi:hypothetical protein